MQVRRGVLRLGALLKKVGYRLWHGYWPLPPKAQEAFDWTMQNVPPWNIPPEAVEDEENEP